MPRATEPASLDRALAKGAALVGAVVIESSIFTVVMGYSDGRIATADSLDSALR
jgi:hypothetical protein